MAVLAGALKSLGGIFTSRRKQREREDFKRFLLENYHTNSSRVSANFNRAASYAGGPLSQRYLAASSSSLIGNWYPGGQDVNRLIAAATPLLRARVRDLVRNFPPFVRAVNSTVAFVVGKGSRFQSLVTHEDGTPNHRLRREIETRFRAWMETCDIAGKLHFYEMQQLAQRQLMENGEFLFRFVRRPASHGRNLHPLALQAHDAEALCAWALSLPESRDGVSVFQGVEYETSTGKVLRYHFQADPSLSNSWDVWSEDAANVLHGFQMLRAGQLRGVSPFVAAVLTAKDMSDYTQAELDRAKMAAKWLAFITSPNPAEYQAMRGMAMRGPDGKPIAGASQERDDIENLENAIIEYLREGEKVEFSPTPNSPGDSFDRFQRHGNRTVSVVADVPYEILSGDYTGINYSTSKASRNDHAQLIAPHKYRMENHFVRRVYYRWLDIEAATKDYLPGYFKNPGFYRKALFIPAGMPSVDPLREGKADVDAMTSLTKAPQQVILARGDDPEEVVQQWAVWTDMLRPLGIDPLQAMRNIDTGLANNPAKLGAEELEG
ncbi:phage portal protein [Desulfovibrio sp. OttesenSCG-928-C06]|nr:phage portal protein [Desulfovibrio sp. OttesenSCG-928-C06]